MKQRSLESIKQEGGVRLFLLWLGNVKRLVYEDNLDACIVITGYEGSGKSTLNIILSLLFKSDLDFYALVDSEHTDEELYAILYQAMKRSGFDVARDTAFDGDQYMVTIQQGQRGDVADFDEGANGLLAREAMSLDNRVLTTAAMVARAKNLIWKICIPNFHNLDHYFRQFRVKIWIHVQSRGEAVFHIAKRNPYFEDVWWQIVMRLQYDDLPHEFKPAYNAAKMDYIDKKLKAGKTRQGKRRRVEDEIPDV